MRIGFSDDEEFPGQFYLWEANCNRSLRGRAGQAALKELEAALLEMPQKRLIQHALSDAEGGVCAIGQLALTVKLRRGMSEVDARRELERESSDDFDTAQYARKHLGFPKLVAWSVVCENDDLIGNARKETPEQRYERVLGWVRSQVRA